MDEYHIPVFLKEVLSFLKIQKGKKYIDATLGGGGHTFEILKRGGIVLGIDVDQEAIDYVREKVKSQTFDNAWDKKKSKVKNLGELVLVKGNFKEIDKIARLKGFDKVSGIIFDLGLSSHQIESRQRGFSYQENAPLDMRMDKDLQVRAKDLINILTKGELYELFTKLGEEYNAYAISSDIVRARRVKPIETTKELALLVQEVYGMKKESNKNKAIANKKVFQALRIAVNDELNNLKEGLPKAFDLLEKEGRLAVISFHSLEDRITKQTFKTFVTRGLGKNLTKKPILPSIEEISLNRRSKSAKLRVFEAN